MTKCVACVIVVLLIGSPLAWAADFTITIPDDKLKSICTSFQWTTETTDKDGNFLECPAFLKQLLQSFFLQAYLAPQLKEARRQLEETKAAQEQVLKDAAAGVVEVK